MKTVAKLIIFPQQTKNGYPFKIRISKEGEQPIIKGLKHFITEADKKKFWNEKKKELLPSYKNYDKIMSDFNIQLKLLGIDPDKKVTYDNIILRSDSFTNYLEKFQDNLKINGQFGLLQKTNTLLLHLTEFRKQKQLSTNIPFIDINIDFLNDFKNYLTINNIKPVTQRGYLEKLKAIINKAIKENKYNPLRHPFLGFEFNSFTNQPKHLTPEIFKLLNSLSVSRNKIAIYNTKTKENVEFPNKLKLIGCKFCFQYYTYGMRVSDMLMLRWSNIYESGTRIKYKMYKTKRDMDILLNNEVLDVLYQFMPAAVKAEVPKLIAQNEGTNTIKFNDGVTLTFNKKVERYEVLRAKLYYLSIHSSYKNKRIFSRIKEEINPIINAELIHKQIGTQTAKYNKELKLLSNFLSECSGNDVSISSHMARHTFAYMALIQGQSIYYISQALNHKSVKTTEEYLRGFPQRYLDNKLYKQEISATDKQKIDNKIRELLASNDYDKKKKFVDMLEL